MKSNDKVAVIAVNVWEQEKGDELTKKVAAFWSKQSFTMQVMLDPDAALIDFGAVSKLVQAKLV